MARYTKNDPNVLRKDTAKGLVRILNELKEALNHMNHGSMRDKEANFHLVYNGTLYIYDICQYLRTSIYNYLAIDFLAFSILSMECHLNLITWKYLDWRTKVYIEMARVYEELNCIVSAKKTVQRAESKI